MISTDYIYLVRIYDSAVLDLAVGAKDHKITNELFL